MRHGPLAAARQFAHAPLGKPQSAKMTIPAGCVSASSETLTHARNRLVLSIVVRGLNRIHPSRSRGGVGVSVKAKYPTQPAKKRLTA